MKNGKLLMSDESNKCVFSSDECSGQIHTIGSYLPPDEQIHACEYHITNDKHYSLVCEVARDLLNDDVLFINDARTATDEDEPEHLNATLYVNCSDVFAWACADAEPVCGHELGPLWLMHQKDKSWGSAIWCCMQRNEMPQKPVEDEIRKAGIWDFDALSLGENVTDDYVQSMFDRIRLAYAKGELKLND